MERVTNPNLVVVVCFSSCTTHKRLVGTNERDAMDAISEFLSLTALMKGIKDSVRLDGHTPRQSLPFPFHVASPPLAEIDAFQHTTHIQTPTLWDTRRERVTSTERNQRKRTTTERSNEKIKRATWGFTTRGHLQWRKGDWTRHRRYLSIAYHSRVESRRTGPAAIGDSISIAHLSPGQIQLCLGALWWTDHTEQRRKKK